MRYLKTSERINKNVNNKVLSLLIVLSMIMTMIPFTYVNADTVYDFQPAGGGQGSDYNSVKLLNPSDITVVEETSEYYLNQINTTVDGTKDEGIKFTFLMSAGTNNFNETFFKNHNMPLIKIYNSETRKTVAAYNSGSGDLKYEGSHQTTDINNHGSYKTDAIYIGVDKGVLKNGTYVLEFGKDVCGNNIAKILGKDVRFNFKVKATPELPDMITEAQDFLKETSIGTASGQYTQSASDTLQKAIDTANDALTSINADTSLTDDQKTTKKEETAGVLYDALQAFKDSRILDITVNSISGIDDSVEVGDTGAASADVSIANITGDDAKQYQNVTWSSDSGCIGINSITGKWTAKYKGTATITATSKSDPTRTGTIKVTVNDPVGVNAFCIDSDSVSLQSLVEGEGLTQAQVTSLKVFTTDSVSLDADDLAYIKAMTGLKTLNLKNAALPENKLPTSAFKKCTSLETVILPDDLTQIGIAAFNGCSSLNKIDIPATVESVQGGAFAGCCSMNSTMYIYSALPPIYAVNDPKYGDALNGLPTESFTTPVKTIYVPHGCAEDYKNATGWEDMTIKEMDEVPLTVNYTSSKGLEEAAVAACKKAGVNQGQVTKLTITSPDSPVKVSFDQTYDLPYLKTHFLGATVIDLTGTSFADDNIQASVFEGRKNAKEIILPTATTHLGKNAFKGCSNLRTMTIPAKVAFLSNANPGIGDSAFADCDKLNVLIMNPLIPPGYSGSMPTSLTSIYVPNASVDDYRNNDIYGKYSSIIKEQSSVSMSASNSVEVLKTKKLTAKINSVVNIGSSIKWELTDDSDSSIASINPSSGVITGKRHGKVIVRATAGYGTPNECSATCTVTVEHPAAPALTTSTKTYNSNTLSWSAMTGAGGYQIFRATSANGSYSIIRTLTGSARSYTDTGRITGKKYYYKVRGYKIVNGVRVYSDYSSVRSVKTAPAKVSLKARAVGSKKVKVSWATSRGAKYYQIYRATSSKGKYKKVKTTKSRSWTNSKLKNKKYYYYKVRPVGKSSSYGSFSSVKKVKVK